MGSGKTRGNLVFWFNGLPQLQKVLPAEMELLEAEHRWGWRISNSVFNFFSL